MRHTVTCPECGHSRELAPDETGKRVKCPDCWQVFRAQADLDPHSAPAARSPLMVAAYGKAALPPATPGAMATGVVPNASSTAVAGRALQPQSPTTEDHVWSLSASLTAMKAAGDFRTMVRLLRPAGIGSIAFGVLAICFGLDGLDVHPVFGVLLLIGAFLLAEGIFIVVRPRRWGFILEGVAMLCVGLWNIAITILAASLGGTANPMWVVLGLWQGGLSLQAFGRYSQFSRLAGVTVPEPLLAHVKSTARELARAKEESAGDIIEFRVGNTTWKGRLSNEMAVFMVGKDLVYAAPDEVVIRAETAKPGKRMPADIQVRDRKAKGRISPESWERYGLWKAGPVR